jgi:LysM repeat protein
MKARYYDPKASRFLTVDPMLEGLNHYGYARNNPLRYTDPTGMWSESEGNWVAEKGDTLGGLARQLGVDYNQLASDNGIADANNIDVGQKINNPNGGGSGSRASGGTPQAPASNSKGGTSSITGGHTVKTYGRLDHPESLSPSGIPYLNQDDKVTNDYCQVYAAVNAALAANFALKEGVTADNIKAIAESKGFHVEAALNAVFQDTLGVETLKVDIAAASLEDAIFILVNKRIFWGKEINPAGVHAISLHGGVMRDPFPSNSHPRTGRTYINDVYGNRSLTDPNGRSSKYEVAKRIYKKE